MEKNSNRKDSNYEFNANETLGSKLIYNKSEYSSPQDLGIAIVEVLRPGSTDKIYDPASGTLGFIFSAKKYIETNEIKAVNGANFYAREINNNVFLKSIAMLVENGLEEAHFYNENSLTTNSKEVEAFDVIISDPPFGLKQEASEGELGIKTNDGSNKFLQHIINSLKPGGSAAVVVSNSFFFSSSASSVEIRRYLLVNCNLHTVLELPQKTFSNTNIGASVLFFIKGTPTKTIKYYLKSFDEDYSSFVDFSRNDVPNKRSYIYNTDNLDRGKFALPTATSFAIEQEVVEKTENFKDFKRYKINELCHEINMTRGVFEERENNVYLPKIGKSDCVTSVKDTTLKHQNYFQLVLDKQKISSGYFAYYMKSLLGQMIIERCFTGSTIPNITKTSLQDGLEVYAPSMEEQNLIASTFDELANVKALMEKTALELSSDPNAAKHILQKLQDTKETFNELSIEEKIMKLVKGGENLNVEFKETLSKNIHTSGKDPKLQTSVLKNIVGFLNKNGGHLLIGVSDKGEIIGIEEDFYKNNDDYKLKLSNLINDRIGSKETNFICYEIHTVRSKKICLINCKKSHNPAYLDGDFYVRTDPECRKLSAKEANDYIRENFKVA